MEQLLSDPSKIVQLVFYVIFGFVVVVGYITGARWKKDGPPKLPVELHLAQEITADIKAIRQASEETRQHTKEISEKINSSPVPPPLLAYHDPPKETP